jgi:hypothetical protein
MLRLLLLGLAVSIWILIELVLAVLTAEGITLTVMRAGGRSFVIVDLHTANWVLSHDYHSFRTYDSSHTNGVSATSGD